MGRLGLALRIPRSRTPDPVAPYTPGNSAYAHHRAVSHGTPEMLMHEGRDAGAVPPRSPYQSGRDGARHASTPQLFGPLRRRTDEEYEGDEDEECSDEDTDEDGVDNAAHGGPANRRAGGVIVSAAGDQASLYVAQRHPPQGDMALLRTTTATRTTSTRTTTIVAKIGTETTPGMIVIEEEGGWHGHAGPPQLAKAMSEGAGAGSINASTETSTSTTPQPIPGITLTASGPVQRAKPPLAHRFSATAPHVELRAPPLPVRGLPVTIPLARSVSLGTSSGYRYSSAEGDRNTDANAPADSERMRRRIERRRLSAMPELPRWGVADPAEACMDEEGGRRRRRGGRMRRGRRRWGRRRRCKFQQP